MSISSHKYSVFLFNKDDTVIPCLNHVFYLNHGQEYKVGIFNHDTKRRINAIVVIDDKDVGEFRVNTESSIIIDRPVTCSRKFTYLAVNSAEGKITKLYKHHPSIVVYIYREYILDIDTDGADTGGTGLGETSFQTFKPAVHVQTERDAYVILHARMQLIQSVQTTIPSAPFLSNYC